MKVLGVACVTAVALTLSSSATAATLWLRDNPNSGVTSSGTPGGIFYDGSESRPFGSIPNETPQVPVGLFDLQSGPTAAGPWTEFLTFCLEPQQGIDGLPAEYTETSLVGYQNLDATEIGWLETLWFNQFDSTKTNATNAAAFQFIIWELVADTSFDLGAGVIQLSSSEAAYDLANLWLDALKNGDWTGSTSLTALHNDDVQDYLSPTSGGGGTGGASTGGEVPEPASLLLMGSGLAGLAARLRTKRVAR